MLSKATTLNGYKLDSLDGGIGEVEEVYFDDEHAGDSLSHHRYTELVAGKKSPGFTAMDRARELERVQSVRQSLKETMAKKGVEFGRECLIFEVCHDGSDIRLIG